MGRVLTNNFSLSYAVQSAFDVFTTTSGDWKLLEPNEIANFGPEITTVARNPISKNRGARKGTITDLDAAVEFTADLTLDSYLDFIEGFAFSVGVNKDLRSVAVSAETTGDTYTVPTMGGAESKLQFSADLASLVYANGFLEDLNNGLKVLDVAATATLISVAENLADETVSTPTQYATVEVAGVRILDSGSLLSGWVWNAGTSQATLTFTVGTIDLTTLGLTAGQFVHIGSPDGSGGVQNALEVSAADDMFGFARIVSFTATTIVFDKTDAALQFTSVANVDVDILFGIFVRNVAVDNAAEYQEKIFLFEGSWPNLYDNPSFPDGFEYLLNSYCNQFSWTLPLTDKSTFTPSFVSTDAQDITDGDTPTNEPRATGADSPLEPVQTTALNTSSNITRLRVTDVDESGLTTDFKNLTVTINNNVTPEKVLGVLGARFVNVGNLSVSVEGNILFTNATVPARIRANTTVTMDFITQTDDGTIVMDLPSMTLGGGGRELPVNESVQLALTGETFIDPVLGFVFSTSIFPITP